MFKTVTNTLLKQQKSHLDIIYNYRKVEKCSCFSSDKQSQLWVLSKNIVDTFIHIYRSIVGRFSFTKVDC